MKKTRTGREGEDLAVKYLRKNGLKIIERNFRTPIGEIDIIARDGPAIVIVEVKTRTSLNFGHPLEAVDQRKQKRLRRLALYYLKYRGIENVQVRFDVLAIVKTDNGHKISYIKEAF
ncbi:MAG: YraN family protein [Nitrospirae bacterium]|nr:YraN family protein [Nitrospirota bacterium]